MTDRRADLEAIRARRGRLTAEQQELLDEHERMDDWFCYLCGCYFASHKDPSDVVAQKSRDHYKGESHATRDRS